MTSNRFYVDKSDVRLPLAVLKGKEHHHLASVARIHPGDTVWLVDADGMSYRARVEKIKSNKTELVILDKKPPIPLDSWWDHPQQARKLVLHEDGDTLLKDVIQSASVGTHPKVPLSESVVILVGPEGGWTKSEQISILERGYEAVVLSDNTLRAETAAITCLAIISHFWNM